METKLLDNLRYEIDQQPISEYPKIINNLVRVTDKIVSIPHGRDDLLPKLCNEIVDKTDFPKVYVPKLNGTLREDQQLAVDHIEGNGLVEAKPGYGKTWVGLSIAHKHQTKTLIITTTTMIRDMWIKEIREIMGIEPGIVGSGKFNIDSPIVVGNIQTVRNRTTELAHEFGLLLIDEVHRAPADTFTYVLNSSYARYKVGLSGTMKRKDKLDIVLPDYFGHTKFVGKDENRLTPEVHIFKFPYELSSNNFIPWSKKVTELLENEKYRLDCLSIINKYIEAGHKVLVVADRTEFLEDLHLCIPDHSVLITGKVKGAETRRKILDIVKHFEGGIALFGTQSIFAEGISENALSALFMATPINNEPLLEQLAGRIQRQLEGKLQPVIIDINLSGNTGRSHANSRKATYIKNGWSIKTQEQLKI
jgi:superfamily II DNA or RNA helicase